MIVRSGGRGQVGIGLELGEGAFDLPSRGGVRRLDERLEDGLFGLVDGIFGAGGDGLAAVRTEVVMGSERFGAVPAALADLRGAVIPIDDAGLGKDVVVVFGGGDVLVGLPHRRVERPVDAVFDLAARVALADHPRDRSVAEGVRSDGLVDVGSIGKALEVLCHRVGPHPAIVGPALLAIGGRRLELVKEGDIWVVRPGVGGPKVGSDRAQRVDQRVRLDRGALEAECVGVRRVGRTLALEVEIADAEREGQREPDAGVGEELDEGDVALVTGRSRQLLDILRREEFALGDALAVDGCALDVFGPLTIGHRLEEREDGVLIGLDRRVGEVVIVSEGEDEFVIAVFVKLDQGRLGAFGAFAEPSEVRLHRGDGDRAVLSAEVPLDGVAIDVVNGVRLPKEPALAVEAFAELLWIVNHTGGMIGHYYKLPVSKTTSSTTSERVEEPLTNSSAAVQGVSA